MIRNLIESSLTKALEDIGVTDTKPELVHQGKKAFGDYSSPVALKIAKDLHQSSEDIANKIKANLDENEAFQVEVSPNGFLNFFLNREVLYDSLQEILKQKTKYGQINLGQGKKIAVEFVSANPTGPLTLGNGRGGFMGDTLANVLDKAGYAVTREYYVNDAGNQIDNVLANSIRFALGYAVDVAKGTDLYGGSYVKAVAEKVEYELGDLDGQKNELVGKKAADIVLNDLIKPTLTAMGIEFDNFFSERDLTKEKLDEVMAFLVNKKLVYEEGGAIWFKASHYGRDKDQVLVTSKALPTYLFKDIAYYYNKLVERKFDQSLIFLGADHHGLVKSHMGAAEALGFAIQVKIILFQLVRLVRSGQEFRMSKRKGDFVTIDDLIDLVGLDAARFFFVNSHANTHLNFDLDLARTEGEANPVYYVQYAHARMSSILKKAAFKPDQHIKLNLLKRESELDLLKHLIDFPELIQKVVVSYDLSEITKYLTKLADLFHHYYEDVRIISDEKELSRSRLALVWSARQVLRNGLKLIGVSHPDKM